MKQINFEYGEGYMAATLPDSAEVFIPGETTADPPLLDDVVSETRKSIQNPIGMPPISELVGPGSKVTISFPDRVKGGFQPSSHRKTCIPLLIEECLKAGVEKKDIKLICAIGLHRKNTDEEILSILGEELYNDFMPSNQIINHDAEDWDNLIDLGYDENGNRVIMNKEVFESDLAILIGHVLGNPYGGYSGGYKMAATGITHWKCIAAHHIPSVMHKKDFTPVSNDSTMRRKMNSIGMYMEKCMEKKFFMCDAVLDTYQRQIAVFSGYAAEMQEKAWEVADKRTYIPWAKHKFDIMMFGMPQNFHYGNGHGTNPILILQAIAANIIRHKPVMNDNCVVICSSICNGYFHDEEFPPYRELYELFLKDYHNTLPDLAKYAEYFCNKQEYIDKYRYNFGYHPFHPFSMISCGHVAEMNCSAIYIVGAYEPGFARGMGMKTRRTFEEALKDAEKYVGPDPKILALPKTFRTAGVHLQMENQ
ncbi:MAG: lactate racemase domain-containing protein [Brevefilum sp.]|jgi:nickel-dependent lactate racemase